ncbi:Restriction alleviation protein, Lar family [Pararobbsia alpina]|uniref:Lar family restriction alleviation protein n=1 Tax=Pararobbsia alpina TaxID=621374 RepID=UPI0039A61B3D
MTSQREKLKPCPFCEGAPNDPQIEQTQADKWNAYIECTRCEVSVSGQFGESSPALALANIEALWNRRP